MVVRKSEDIRCLCRCDIREFLEEVLIGMQKEREAKMRLNIITEHNVPTSSWSLQKVGTEEGRIDSLTYIKKISHWYNLL